MTLWTVDLTNNNGIDISIRGVWAATAEEAEENAIAMMAVPSKSIWRCVGIDIG